MPETAYYDPVQFQNTYSRRMQEMHHPEMRHPEMRHPEMRHPEMRHTEMRQPRVLHAKPNNAENLPVKRMSHSPRKATKESSDDSGSSEDIYESLEQVNHRKNIDAAHRRAKISRVRRTGHPLFDSLREERALKENVKTPKPKSEAQNVSKNIGNKQKTAGETRKTIPNSQSTGALRNFANHPNAPRIVVHESEPQSKSRKHSAQFMSLQRLNPEHQSQNMRKFSEGYLSRTLPAPLALTKKNLAKSEQNLSYHQRSPHQINLGGQYQFMMVGPHGQNHMSPYWAPHGKHQMGQKPQKVAVESSDSDSDWIIPRPKFATQKSRHRSSDDSDYSGPLWR